MTSSIGTSVLTVRIVSEEYVFFPNCLTSFITTLILPQMPRNINVFQVFPKEKAAAEAAAQ